VIWFVNVKTVTWAMSDGLAESNLMTSRPKEYPSIVDRCASVKRLGYGAGQPVAFSRFVPAF
jgi:hypothetical protein